MWGEVGLHSTPGLGSTFWFRVPMQHGHGPMPMTPTAMADDAESRLSTRHRGAHVLLAEDHAINVEVVIEILHAVGIDVAVAVNGREAVQRACYQTFDLILMDIQMPEMGGIEATRLIRGLPQWADRPIIALTAKAFAEDRQACLAAGMNDILTKPVEPSLLYSTLLHWLAPTVRAKHAPVLVQNQRTFDASDDTRVILALRTREGIDVEAGLAMLRGKTSKYLALVCQLVDTQSLQILALMLALDAGDRVAARRTAYGLKSAAATLGLGAFAECALRLEQLLTTEDDLDVQREAIQMALAEVLAALRDIEAVVTPACHPQ
jgi:two-component system sensor histidine kinase/response regulator